MSSDPLQEDPELRPQHRHQADRGRGAGVQGRGEDQVQGQVRTDTQTLATREHFLLELQTIHHGECPK